MLKFLPRLALISGILFPFASLKADESLAAHAKKGGFEALFDGSSVAGCTFRINHNDLEWWPIEVAVGQESGWHVLSDGSRVLVGCSESGALLKVTGRDGSIRQQALMATNR